MGGDTSERRAAQQLRVEAEREALLKSLDKQDERLRLRALDKVAAAQKRLANTFDPRPARREMYDDRTLQMAAQVPGPGEYTPRLRDKDKDMGKTFGVPPSASVSGASSIGEHRYVRDAGSPDAWKVKTAAMQPGPASYSPLRPKGSCGSTFGLPPELRGSKEVPSAHDISKMVDHLRELPAPDAYSPRNPMEKNKGFRMVPSKALSSLEQVMQASAKVPGPGRYESDAALSAGRSTVMGAGGTMKSELDITMERAKQLPGPGAYAAYSQLRSKGSPRFSSAGGLSLIEAIQVEARVRGPSRLFRPAPLPLAVLACPPAHSSHHHTLLPSAALTITSTCNPRVWHRPSPGRAPTTQPPLSPRSSRCRGTCAMWSRAPKAVARVRSSRVEV